MFASHGAIEDGLDTLLLEFLNQSILLDSPRGGTLHGQDVIGNPIRVKAYKAADEERYIMMRGLVMPKRWG